MTPGEGEEQGERGEAMNSTHGHGMTLKKEAGDGSPVRGRCAGAGPNKYTPHPAATGATGNRRAAAMKSAAEQAEGPEIKALLA